MYLDLAQIGPTTELLESVASSVAAGMAMGGFVGIVGGLLRGRSRLEVEKDALRDTCLGGLGGIALLLVDLISRLLP